MHTRVPFQTRLPVLIPNSPHAFLLRFSEKCRPAEQKDIIIIIIIVSRKTKEKEKKREKKNPQPSSDMIID